MVGNAIGTKFIESGYEVRMGSRTPNNEKAMDWASKNGKMASTGTFNDAASFGELIVFCIKGESALSVLTSLRPELVEGKTIMDIAVPLDFSKGMPPFIIPDLSNTNSLGEEMQKQFPLSNVVKTFTVVNCQIMVNPLKFDDTLTMFLAGNNTDAKKQVKDILQQFGWQDIIDLGDISAARGLEAFVPFWVRIMVGLNTPNFGIKIVR